MFDLDFNGLDVKNKFSEIIDFDKDPEIPTGSHDTFAKVTANMERIAAKLGKNNAAGGDSGLESE